MSQSAELRSEIGPGARQVSAKLDSAFSAALLGKRLAPLRDQGVLVVGSGNIVHNLRLMDRSLIGRGPEWASQFDGTVQRHVRDGDDQALVEYERQPYGDLAVPTPDHYLPLLYAVGLRQNDDTCETIVDGLDIGCVSMTSIQFHN